MAFNPEASEYTIVRKATYGDEADESEASPQERELISRRVSQAVDTMRRQELRAAQARMAVKYDNVSNQSQGYRSEVIRGEQEVEAFLNSISTRFYPLKIIQLGPGQGAIFGRYTELEEYGKMCVYLNKTTVAALLELKSSLNLTNQDDKDLYNTGLFKMIWTIIHEVGGHGFRSHLDKALGLDFGPDTPTGFDCPHEPTGYPLPLKPQPERGESGRLLESEVFGLPLYLPAVMNPRWRHLRLWKNVYLLKYNALKLIPQNVVNRFVENNEISFPIETIDTTDSSKAIEAAWKEAFEAYKKELEGRSAPEASATAPREGHGQNTGGSAPARSRSRSSSVPVITHPSQSQHTGRRASAGSRGRRSSITGTTRQGQIQQTGRRAPTSNPDRRRRRTSTTGQGRGPARGRPRDCCTILD